MSLIRVDVETIVVGGGPIASLVILKPRNVAPADGAEGEGAEVEARTFQPLPIRLGLTEAATIGMGVENPLAKRPMTHDLFLNVLKDAVAAVDGQ